MSTPRFVVHVSEVAEEEGGYPAPFDAEKMSFGRNVAKAAGSERIGMWHERIPPGRRTSFTHAHSHDEEMLYVLEGECVLRIVEPGQSPREFSLRAGHVASFPSGTGIAHSVHNRSAQDVLILAIGERHPGVDTARYPEDPQYDAWNQARKR